MLRDTCYVIRESNGFTLIEVLVALFIFSTVAIMAVSLYASAVNLERQGAVHRVVQQNGNFVTEFLGKEIRNGAIDYSGYASEGINLSLQPIDRLKLFYRGNQDLREEIYLQDDKVFIKRERINEPGVFDVAALTNDTVLVDSLYFYVRPTSACTEAACGGQQRVTMALRIRSNIEEMGTAQPLSIDLQSTFSVRLYDL